MAAMIRVGAFGEVLMRLTPPGNLLLEQTHDLRVDYTGTGANILANLSHFGLGTQLLTALPKNRLGDAAAAALRGYGVGVDHVVRARDYLGSYVAELGFGPRATEVVYQDRRSSAFCTTSADEYDVDAFLAGVDMVHICGISLSLTDAAADAALRVARRAREMGRTVVFDFNYRPSLNVIEGAEQAMRERYDEMLPLCDVVFGGPLDVARQCGRAAVDREDELGMVTELMDRSGLRWFVGTEKSVVSGEGGPVRLLAGVVYTRDEHGGVVRHASRPRTIAVLDRIGAGDAYAAGIIFGIASGWAVERMADFAVANAALANATYGDVPLTTVEQVERLFADPYGDLVR